MGRNGKIAAGGGGVVAIIAAALIALAGSSPKTTFGVDFGWGGPSASAMRAVGARFGASYLSYDFSKNWHLAQLVAYHQAGIASVNVWETGATRSAAGYWAGRADAQEAARQASQLGEPANRPIYFAVDFDASGSQVASYFDGVKSVIGLGRAGVYAGYYPTKYLFDTHRISYAWQTYAWSRGQWDPRAQLQQYSNSHLVGGRDVDYDRGVRVDYGQWPYKAPAVVPKPDPYRIFDKTVRRFAGASASEYNTVKTWDRHGCRNPVKRSVCRNTRFHMVLLHARLAHILLTDPTCIATFGSCPTQQGLRLYNRGAREAGLSRRLRAR